MTQPTVTPRGSEKAADKKAIRPFRVSIPKRRSPTFAAGSRPRDGRTKKPSADHSQGVQLPTIQKLARYWVKDYDWRKCEARLNALPQFITEIDGLDIHFIHVQFET